MEKLKIPIAIIILVTLLVSYAPPRETHAQAVVITKAIACTIGGAAAGWLTDQIFNKLKSLYLKLPVSVARFLGFGVLSIFFPSDVPTNSSRITNKEHFGDIVARCGALAILDKVSRQTIYGIRTSGRDGGPAFVRNWRNFKLDAQHRGENIFRSILGNTTLCGDYGPKLRSIYGAIQGQPISGNTRVDNLDFYKTRATCTLPQGWTLNNFKNDFSGNGGWGALVRLAEPQNNFYGSLLMSAAELAIQRATEENSDLSSVMAGLGFDSRRGKNATDSCQKTDIYGKCLFYKDILTPGSYLQQSAVTLAQQELAWVTNTDEINELIADLTIRLFGRILDLSGERPSSAVLDGKAPKEGAPELDPIYPDTPDPTQPQCSDSIDNDGDTLTDYPNDPGCTDPNDPDEADGGGGFCDGTDQDGDGNACDAFLGENLTSCPRDCGPAVQCQNATDTNGDSIADTGDDDGDGLVDARGLGWINGPDPDCDSPSDNSEAPSGATQCSDGFDNDGDGNIDLADPDCSGGPTDDSEITYVIDLCADNGPTNCQAISASIPNLAGSTVGDNNAEYLIAGVLTGTPGFILELCLDANYVNCTTITGAMVDGNRFTPPRSSGEMSLSEIGLDNQVSSIRITQP